MNFFEQQDIARRNTKRLVVLLLLAVLSLIAITVIFVAGTMAIMLSPSDYSHAGQSQPFIPNLLSLITWEMLAWISFTVGTVVALGGVYKQLQLRSGGRAVAEAMNGRLINLHTDDADEKKILNVVEEIAIASGTPVPPVYIIEDAAINAFAAGHTPQDAVIGITRGCIHLLTRDELQGVIAHEFSHIFHGDMRLNIRLVALLHGILLLGLIGSFLIRSTHHRSMMRSSRDKSPAAILIMGLGLVVIGYAGTFFGNIIKAAVSRQREFLADASAVQFTRNPDGIAGALKKIGSHGSRLEAEHTAEYSHMLFSQGISTAFNALMATHPPIDKRIKRIDPRWDGTYAPLGNPGGFTPSSPSAHQPTPAAASNLQGAAIATAITQASMLDASIEAIGQPSASHLADAQKKLQAIGPELHAAAHDPFSARALIFGLLLDSNRQRRETQWQHLEALLTAQEMGNLQPLAEEAACLDPSLRLPLTELALPALKALTSDQRQTFKDSMKLLIQADKRVTILEWALQRIVLHHLEPAPKTAGRTYDLRECRDECQILLSILAYAGAQQNEDATAAFVAATQELRFVLPLLEKQHCKMDRLDQALTRLANLKPLQKPILLKAMASAITQDGQVTIAEAELFRAIADGLDCPVPPLVSDR